MNRRDIELLSAYLDGELKPSDSTKLEARLQSDPELASTLKDLRATRALLRQLPQRKAPRNFTLTRKMVGLNPPLPRAYPIFRFATAVATLLFFFSFAANAVAPRLAQPYNLGRGGGSPQDTELFAAAPAATEAAAEAPAEAPAPAQPALESPPATPVEVTMPALAEVAPTATLVPQGTAMPPAEDTTRIMETPSVKTTEIGGLETQNQAPVVGESVTTSESQKQPPLIPSAWQVGLAVVVVIGALFMGLMRQFSARRWK